MKQISKEELIQYFMSQIGNNSILNNYLSTQEIKERLNKNILGITYVQKAGASGGTYSISTKNVNICIEKFHSEEEFKKTIVHELLHALSFSEIEDETTKSAKIGFQINQMRKNGTFNRSDKWFYTSDMIWRTTGKAINEGITELLTEEILGITNKDNGYQFEKDVTRELFQIMGKENIISQYFSQIKNSQEVEEGFEYLYGDIINEYYNDVKWRKMIYEALQNTIDNLEQLLYLRSKAGGIKRNLNEDEQKEYENSMRKLFNNREYLKKITFSTLFMSNQIVNIFGCDDKTLEKLNDSEGHILKVKPQDLVALKEKKLLKLCELADIYVENEKDFECFMEHQQEFSEIKEINVSSGLLLNKGVPPYKYNICMNNINELSIEQLEILNKNRGNLNKINLRGNPTYQFGLDEFIRTKKVVNDITKDIDMEEKEITKFLKLYEKLGKNISYKQSAGVKDAMFKFQACCHGYSRLLNLVLNNVGIQSINVRGHSCINGNEEGHEWNKVKIDGKWYNCDLTWDSQNMKENKCVNYCLRSDNVFFKRQEHKLDTDTCKRYVSNYDYNQEIVQKYFQKEMDMER